MTQDIRESTNSGGSVVLNWVLALASLLGAAAVVLFAYVEVLGAAGCTTGTCGKLGPNQFTFTAIVWGAPLAAVAAVLLSFFTARRRFGLLVPAVAWALLIICTAVLAVTFP